MSEPAAPLNHASEQAEILATDPHTQAVNQLFGELSPNYDLQNRLFSLCFDRWWRRVLVSSISSGPTGQVLDLAAGTLDISVALCRRYPSLHVIAADICQPMLDYGMTHKVSPEERNRISPLVADARHLPLPDASVDAVTMAFGIRNVLPRAEALAEMHRVLVPGGNMCILEFAPLTLPVLGPLYHAYLDHIMPTLASAISGSKASYKYLAKTIRDFPSPAAFTAEIAAAQFHSITHRSLTLGIAHLHVGIK